MIQKIIVEAEPQSAECKWQKICAALTALFSLAAYPSATEQQRYNRLPKDLPMPNRGQWSARVFVDWEASACAKVQKICAVKILHQLLHPRILHQLLHPRQSMSV
jgi:hypothetical protein